MEMNPTTHDGTDAPPVAGDNLTELLRVCLVALRLPLDATAYRLRPQPFWSVSDAAARITRLLDTLPKGAALETFVPPITVRPLRALRCRAAVATTFIAGLELSRDGGLTFEQEIAWYDINVRRRVDDLPVATIDIVIAAGKWKI